MHNKLFDKEVNEVVLVFKWITARHFGLCHTLIGALGLKGGDTAHGRSFGMVAPGRDTNQEGQLLLWSLYREEMKKVHPINSICSAVAYPLV